VSGLSLAERGFLGDIDPEPILARTLDWAAINSGTTNMDGLKTMAGKLAEAFSALPGTVRFAEPAAVEKVDAEGHLRAVPAGQHMVVSVRPQANRRVIITGHMDTVFAADHPFQSCKWLDDDTLNGPGTADMKGGLSVMLAGLSAYEASGGTLGYDVMINSDEETGSLTSAPLIAELAAGKLAALTYEPALPGGQMARARPGSGNYAAIVRGKSAHAGRNPQDGRNAIVAAADLALRLSGEVREGLSINPARMEGGGPNNTVPDLAILHFNLRPRTPELADHARTLIDTLVAAIAEEHDVLVQLHGGVSRPPKPVSETTERLYGLVSEAARDLGQEMTWKDTGGVCDGNNIAACGVPVLDTMGACGGAIHSPDEFLQVSSLAERAKLTALVLHRVEQRGLGA
jgi:glutamate carboxypeptidase